MARHRPTPEQLRAAKREAKQLFADRDDVQGVGIGDGCLRVYVRDRASSRRLPDEVAHVRIECVEVGVIDPRADRE